MVFESVKNDFFRCDHASFRGHIFRPGPLDAHFRTFYVDTCKTKQHFSMYNILTPYLPSRDVVFKKSYAGTKGSHRFENERFRSYDIIEGDVLSWVRRVLDRETYERLERRLFTKEYPVSASVDLETPYGSRDGAEFVSFIRYVFRDQILGRTRCASGGVHRRTFLTGLSELKRGIINQSFSFPLSRMVSKPPSVDTGVAWLLKSLSYSDSASIWNPVDVAKLLQRHGHCFDHVVAVCGSWGSVGIACDILSRCTSISVQRYTCIDVLDDMTALETCGYEWPFEYDTLCQPSQYVTLDTPGTLFVWNPPYYVSEIYDADELTFDQHETQSTSMMPIIHVWKERYIQSTAISMARSAARGAKLIFVTSDTVSIHGSLRSMLPTEGFEKKGGMYIYRDFHTDLVQAISKTSLWRVDITRPVRSMPQGTGKVEVLTVFTYTG